MSQSLPAILLSGLLSSGLFLVVFGLGLGFLFMFLPTLPLFYVGFTRRPKTSLDAALAAGVIVAIVAGLAGGMLYLLFLGLPVWYMVRRSQVVFSDKAGQKYWMPIGIVMTDLTLYACAGFALIALYLALQPGGLSHMLAQNIHEGFADLEEDYGDVVALLAGPWSFLVFSMTVWLWSLALYGHGWLAHRMAIARKLALRPDFAVEPFILPGWMLSLLAICGLASLIGSPAMSLVGKATFISLLLPYFFSGIAFIHLASRSWESRRFFLFFIYFLLFSLLWPMLAVAGIGLWQQIKCLSEAKTSSKN